MSRITSRGITSIAWVNGQPALHFPH